MGNELNAKLARLRFIVPFMVAFDFAATFVLMRILDDPYAEANLILRAMFISYQNWTLPYIGFALMTAGYLYGTYRLMKDFGLGGFTLLGMFLVYAFANANNAYELYKVFLL
jgi:hypothetical protein